MADYFKLSTNIIYVDKSEVKTRKDANIVITMILADLVNYFPDWRFQQLLTNVGLATPDDLFYEESLKTLDVLMRSPIVNKYFQWNSSNSNVVNINDFKKFNRAKEERIDLIEKKDKFIKDNNLEGFVSENVEQDEENLRIQHEQKKIELDTKDDEINQNEEKIAKRDAINDAINVNLDLIKDYEEKIKIAKLASDLKFNSFVYS